MIVMDGEEISVGVDPAKPGAERTVVLIVGSDARTILTELLRLYDLRQEIAAKERDFNGRDLGGASFEAERKEIKALLLKYGREKKAAWAAARHFLSSTAATPLIVAAFAVVILSSCTSAWFPERHPRSSAPPADPPVRFSSAIDWSEVHDVDGWLVVYRSGDGRWQIEPAINNDGADLRPGKEWALIDRRAAFTGAPEWLAIGTLEELEARAAAERR